MSVKFKPAKYYKTFAALSPHGNSHCRYVTHNSRSPLYVYRPCVRESSVKQTSGNLPCSKVPLTALSSSWTSSWTGVPTPLQRLCHTSHPTQWISYAQYWRAPYVDVTTHIIDCYIYRPHFLWVNFALLHSIHSPSSTPSSHVCALHCVVYRAHQHGITIGCNIVIFGVLAAHVLITDN